MLELAGLEMHGQKGPLRDRLLEAYRRSRALLVTNARRAIRNDELPRRADPRQITFELRAVIAGLTMDLQLRPDPKAFQRARRAVGQVLGFPGKPAVGELNRS